MDIEIKIIDTILKWEHIAKNSKRIQYVDNGTTFTIPAEEFGLGNNFRIHKFIQDFLDKLKECGCFKDWQLNPYKAAEIAEYIFTEVSVDSLKRYKNSLSEKPQILKDRKQAPSFNPTIGILYFKGEEIEIGTNSFESDLCALVFKNEKTVKKAWGWEQIINKIGEIPDKKLLRKIYYAARRINFKIAVKTNIDDLLIYKDYSIIVNSKYLPQ